MCRSKVESPPDGRRCPSNTSRSRSGTATAQTGTERPKRRPPIRQPNPRKATPGDWVRWAYRRAARDAGWQDGDLVPLRMVRDLIPGIPRDEVDKALDAFYDDPGIRFALHGEANQKALTDDDRRAELWSGGERRHYMSLAPI